MIRGFDVFNHAGFYELATYLLAAAVSFRFILWHSDGKKIIASRKWQDVRLSAPEKMVLVLEFVILFVSAFVESYGIVHLVA